MLRRILILNERDLENPLAGGAEVNLFEIFGPMARKGVEVTLICASFPGAARETSIEGIRVLRLANRYLFYALAPLAARRELRRSPCDLVVDILAKLPFFSPWLLPAPCLAFTHHLFGNTAFQQVALPVATVSVALEKLIPRAYRDTPHIAVSPSTRDDLVARGLPAERIRVVPNGVDHARYRPEPAEKTDVPLIVWVGRVEPYKRIDLVLRALVELRGRLPEARLVVVGEGSHLAAMRTHAAELGLSESVEFTGFVPTERKVELMRRAHTLVNTSEKEGWGLTVIEGAACGTATVASDVPGLRDSVLDERCGLLVPHGDTQALAAALLRVLRDTALRERLQAGAIEWAGRFRWEGAAADVEQIASAAAEGRDVSGLELAYSPF